MPFLYHSAESLHAPSSSVEPTDSSSPPVHAQHSDVGFEVGFEDDGACGTVGDTVGGGEARSFLRYGHGQWW